MDRRNFIKKSLSLAATSAAAQLIPRWVMAATQNISGQFFIYIHLHNAWDTSLFSDPYLDETIPDPGKYFIEYNRSQLIQVGTQVYGPALLPLKKYLPRMSVVNGLFMNASDIGHDSLASYMAAGANGHGSVTGDIYSAMPESLGVMSNNLILPMPERAPLVQLQSLRGVSEGTLLDQMTVGKVTVKGNVIESVYSDLKKQTLVLPSLSDQLKTTSQLTQNSDWLTIAAAFASGASSVAQVSLNSEFLDTHTNHERNHLTALSNNFRNIADLLKVLQSVRHPTQNKTLLDCTTILIASEFCRTPGLNPQKGKDHNPTSNAALLLGPGIKGGTSVGKTRLITPSSGQRSYLAAVPVTEDTEQPMLSQTGTKLIRPSHVWKTVLASMKISGTQDSGGSGQSKILKTILKG